MASIFSKIVSGEIPCFKIAENEHCIAFLDINPLSEGHTLVIPKKEVDYLFDLENELYQEVMAFAKEVVVKIEAVIHCERIGVAVIGLEVPHAHVHLVPINHVGDINFSRPKLEVPSSRMQELAEAIQNA